MIFLCPAGMGAFSLFITWAACAWGARRTGSIWPIKHEVLFSGGTVPCGHGAFSFYFVWAACVAASLLAEFWPPSRRAADGGLLGAAAPPRPPLHSPRITPLDFSYPTSSLDSHQIPPQDNSIGFPTTTSPRGLHGLCFGSFPPFGRVISLRAAQCHRTPSL